MPPLKLGAAVRGKHTQRGGCKPPGTAVGRLQRPHLSMLSAGSVEGTEAETRLPSVGAWDCLEVEAACWSAASADACCGAACSNKSA